MTDITATRSALCTWASRQPDRIRDRAQIIALNLSGLRKAPSDKVLLAETKENVAWLARLTLKTAYRD